MATLQVALAPEQLWQAINPWNFYLRGAQFGMINLNIGQTAHPEVEQTLIDEVGSYGKQIGRIGDALEVLVSHFDRQGLTPEEKDALTSLLGQLADVRKIKARALAEGT